LKLQPVRAIELAVEAANLYESFMDSKDLEVIEPPKPEELIYGETEEDFKFWCQAFEKTYEKWDNVGKRGFANGKKWRLKSDKHGFEEDTETPTPTPVVTTDTNKLEEFKEFLRTKFPNRTFDNPKHLGGNKYKSSDESPVTYEYENGNFIAK
jgi:hypothetical protein